MDPDDKSILSFFNITYTEFEDRERQIENTSGQIEPLTLEKRFIRWLEITDR